jgi:hypothetical protein
MRFWTSFIEQRPRSSCIEDPVFLLASVRSQMINYSSKVGLWEVIWGFKCPKNGHVGQLPTSALVRNADLADKWSITAITNQERNVPSAPRQRA